MSLRAIIIGSGIGGLSAAIALEQIGIDVTIYERAHELREIGAGIMIWPNAIRALERLKVADAVMAAGVPITHNRMRAPGGKFLSERSLMAAMQDAYGVPTIGIHRAALQGALRDQVTRAKLHLDATCVQIDQDESSVTARFQDGTTATGDILIGADGIRSVVREQVLGPSRLRFTGFAAWRGVAQMTVPSLPAYSAFETPGRGVRFGGFHIGPDRIFWYAGINTTPGKEPPRERRKAMLHEHFRGWHEPIAELIDAVADDEIFYHDVYDLEPLSRWGEGRVALLGDAAHAMTPRLGQGAAQAFEDAVSLADCLRAGDDPRRALRSYEARRLERARAIVELSWKTGKLLQHSNPVMVWLRNQLLTRIPVRSHLQRMDWIFGYRP